MTRIPPYCWQILSPAKIIGTVVKAVLVPVHGIPRRHALTVTTVAEIGQKRREALANGLPTHLAVSDNGDWLFLYPTPIEPYELTITEEHSWGSPLKPGGRPQCMSF